MTAFCQMPSSDKQKEFKYEARIEMPSESYAEIVAKAINVDPELRPDEVSRIIHVDGNAFIIDIAATDLKSLRTSVSSVYDFIRVSLAALAEFGS